MSHGIVQSALAAWGLEKVKCTLFARRENIVYRVQTSEQTFALRLHRPGYHSVAALQSELAWMAHLKKNGLSVPSPIPTKNGALFHTYEGTNIDLLTWLPGTPLGDAKTALFSPRRAETLHSLGTQMARLHSISDIWKHPEDFTRPRWDIDGLIGETPFWGRYWENPKLTPNQREIMETARAQTRTALSKTSFDFGLIHADLIRENVLLDDHTIHLIDFDDAGFGFRLFDIATTLLKYFDEPDYPALRSALLSGYTSIRPIDTTHLQTFLMIRACTYVGWIMSRIEEPGALERCELAITTAITQIQKTLEQEPSHV